MRAFLAIEIDEGVRDRLRELLARLRTCGAKVTWVKPENAHLTLRFLGEIDEVQANRLGERLARAYRDVVPFTLTVRGVGAFPNVRRPRVVWTGVSGSDALHSVQREAEEAARHIGCAPEATRYTPHVTLGRVRDERRCGDLRAVLEGASGFEAGDIVVKRAVLLKSTLSPQGSIYTLIREFPFQWTSHA